MKRCLIALFLVSGCSTLKVRGTPQERETVYAVVGTMLVMTVIAVAVAPDPAKEPSDTLE